MKKRILLLVCFLIITLPVLSGCFSSNNEGGNVNNDWFDDVPTDEPITNNLISRIKSRAYHDGVFGIGGGKVCLSSSDIAEENLNNCFSEESEIILNKGEEVFVYIQINDNYSLEGLYKSENINYSISPLLSVPLSRIEKTDLNSYFYYSFIVENSEYRMVANFNKLNLHPNVSFAYSKNEFENQIIEIKVTTNITPHTPFGQELVGFDPVESFEIKNNPIEINSDLGNYWYAIVASKNSCLDNIEYPDGENAYEGSAYFDYADVKEIENVKREYSFTAIPDLSSLYWDGKTDAGTYKVCFGYIYAIHLYFAGIKYDNMTFHKVVESSPIEYDINNTTL